MGNTKLAEIYVTDDRCSIGPHVRVLGRQDRDTVVTNIRMGCGKTFFTPQIIYLFFRTQNQFLAAPSVAVTYNGDSSTAL
jgi:hypothetical protein